LLEAGGVGDASMRKPVFRFGEAGEGLIAAVSGSRLSGALLQLSKRGTIQAPNA